MSTVGDGSGEKASMEVLLSASGRIALFVSALGLASGLAPASAQENLDRNRTPAQMYASDCAECHRNPKAVLKTVSPGSLPGYLREHYTASKESAAAIASYLLTQVPDPRATPPRAPAKPPAAKPPAAKPADGQPTEAKPADAKPASEPKSETAPAAPTTAPAKPSEPVAKPSSEGSN
jgi:mono/diheme cytochrome c family protein